MAAVIFGNVFPRWFLRTLITHRWNNAETVPKAAAAGWEARGDSNWIKLVQTFSCRNQVKPDGNRNKSMQISGFSEFQMSFGWDLYFATT